MPLVTGEIDDVETIQHTELDALLGRSRKVVAQVVEILDIIDTVEVDPAEFGHLATECKRLSNATKHPGCDEGAADFCDATWMCFRRRLLTSAGCSRPPEA